MAVILKILISATSIEYEQSLFTKLPIYCLNDNSVEMLKIIPIYRSLDNKRYKRNPQNNHFNDLPFDDDERLLARQRLYCINNNIVFKLINGLSVYINKNRM